MGKVSGKHVILSLFFFKQTEVKNKVSGLVLFIRLAGEKKKV